MIHVKEEDLEKPVMLFNKHGEVFKMKSINNDVEMKFFLIISFDKKCVTLMCLRACYLCFEKHALATTHQYVTIDKTAFCGYHILHDISVENCTHYTCCIHDSFCKKFTIWPENKEVIIWTSNLHTTQFGTLQLLMEKPQPVKVAIHQMNGSKKIYRYTNPIHLNQCRKITIYTEGKEKVTGEFKIEMDSMITHE